MNDALDRLALPGAELLARVDATLVAHGVPPTHPVIALLRQLGALSGDVLDAMSAWRPAPLRDAASDLRHTAEEYEQMRDLLTVPTGWSGHAGNRFSAYRESLVGFWGQTGDRDEAGLVGRLRATAAYLDDVAEWLERSRGELARSIAEVLASVEAVRLHASGDTEAAATIAARILTPAADAYADGRAIADRWAGRLDEVLYRPPAAGPPPMGETWLALG